MAGNVVEAQLSARTETQLPQAVIELVHSRGPLLSEPLPAAAIDWATVLTATALPEGQPYPRALSGARRACSTRSRPRRRRRAGARRWCATNCCCSPSSASASISSAARSPAATMISSRSVPSRAVRSAPPKPSLMPASSCRCRAFVREGGRGDLARNRPGPRPHRPFPAARRADRSRRGPIAEARDRLVERLRRAGGLA